MPEADQHEPDGGVGIAAEPSPKRQSKFRIHVVVPSALLIFGLAFLTRQYVLEGVVVEGGSMEPTLKPGTRLVALKLPWVLEDLQRGDIIILREPDDNTIVVKRIVALPGDTIQLRNGSVFVNGKQLDEPYVNPAEPTPDITSRRVVSPNGLVVMGDNRNHSVDSRSYGPVPLENVIARVVLAIWPLDEFGAVRS